MRRFLAALAWIGIVAASLVVPVSAANAAPLTTSTRTVTVNVDGRTFSARLVQPTGSAPDAYPVVAFGHGFTQSSSRYASTLTSIAARGYIVIAPDSETGLSPSHSRFADDLWRALEWVRSTQPNADPSLDAVSGHSMGGGAALIAADRHPEIDTVATLAAAETRPSATTASRGVTVAALFVVGSSDTVVKPATTKAMYTAKPSPATFASITGGYHCGFTDSSSFLGIGCDSGPISRAKQLPIAAGLLGGWLDTVLKGKPAAAAPAGVVVIRK